MKAKENKELQVATLLSVKEVRRKVAREAFEVEKLHEAMSLSKEITAPPAPNTSKATNKEIHHMLETEIDEVFLQQSEIKYTPPSAPQTIM